MTNEKMKRISKKNPCPICGKTDWCLIAQDNTAAICQRIQDGSKKRCGDAGYLHILADRPKSQNHRSRRKFAIGQDNKPSRDFKALQQFYSSKIKDEQLNDVSQQLGVSINSLTRLRIGWDGKAYTFPMSNDFGDVIGIQRRFPNGRKVSVNGSKTGLFIPSDLPAEDILLICEGPTDTVAALDLSYAAFGRPSCNSKVEMTANFSRGRAVIIVSDNDSVGRKGSKRLARVLSLSCPSVKIIYPPKGIKDLRQWLKAGLSKEILQELIREIKPIEIKISFKD